MSVRRSIHGFTLIELLLALALASVVFVALVRLVDTCMTIWERTETTREVEAVSHGILDLFEADLRALEGGPRGDLLSEWRMLDVDRDGVARAPHLLVRFVRQAAAADLLELDPDRAIDVREVDLVEVCWSLQPNVGDDADARPIGVLMRGSRRLGDEETVSFFDEDFLDSRGRPLAGALEEVSGGVLWINAQFASQTSIVHEGWEPGDELRHVARSWDAWGRGRPDQELTDWNRPHPGSPRAEELPILPRRIRLELELERPSELRRRPRLNRGLEPDENRLVVDDQRYLPLEGSHVLVDEEWMLVTGRRGDSLTVVRGARGTVAAPHAPGAKVHFGTTLSRELPVALYREDWNL